MIKYIASLLLLTMLTMSCTDYTALGDAEYVNEGLSAAIPLVNTEMSIGTISERLGDGNAAIVIDSEGKPTIKYQGDIIQRDASAIFPPFPVLIDIPIDGPSSSWNLEELAALTSAFDNNVIKRAIFNSNNVFFRLQHDEDAPVTFTITIPSFTLDGVPFTGTYEVPPKFNEADIYVTILTSLDNYDFIPIDNTISFEYTAVDQSGATVDMIYTALKLDLLDFKYVEGFFGERVFDIEGDVIAVGLFDKWISGGLQFEDPRLVIEVENSFGFPVETDFKDLGVKTVTGLDYQIESNIIEEGVAFNYPTLDEVGQIKITKFDFNSTNSNIQQIFVDKVSSVSYDIDARANPDADIMVDGFLNKDSYFNINVSIDLPVQGSINELVLTDTLDLDIGDYDDVDEVELKFLITNGFPMNLRLKAIVLDDNNVVIDDLFGDEDLVMVPAVLGNDGRALAGVPTERYVTISAERYNSIKQGTKIALVGNLDSSNVSNENLWVYDDYVLDFKLGAIVKLN